MGPRIRGSDVYVVEDIERILSALAGAARRYSGEYGSGYMDALRDVAAGVGGRVDGVDRVDVVREVVEYRHERTVERYQAAPPPTFAIRGEREAWPAVEQYQAQPTQIARQAPADRTGDNVNLATFWQRKGELRERQEGYVWVGNDGYTAFWSKADWQLVAARELCAWGDPVSDEHWALVRHAYANDKRRRLGQSVRVLPTERRQLR